MKLRSKKVKVYTLCILFGFPFMGCDEEESIDNDGSENSSSEIISVPEGVDPSTSLDELVNDVDQVTLVCDVLDDQVINYVDQNLASLKKGVCAIAGLSASDPQACKLAVTECTSTEFVVSDISECDPDGLRQALQECDATLDLYLQCVDEGLSLIRKIGDGPTLNCENPTEFGLRYAQDFLGTTACRELQMTCPSVNP